MQKLSGINLVIASGSEKIQNCLQNSFSKLEAKVVLCGFLNLDFVNQLEQETSADVILIDMDDSYEEDEEALDRLLERIDLPILFHDNDFDDINNPAEGCGFSELAIEKLADKLAELVDNSHKKSASQDQIELESETGISSKTNPDIEAQIDDLELTNDEVADGVIAPELDIQAELLDTEVITETDDNECDLNVWVLGSSIGGPEALKRFLARVPRGLPVAFVLAQHLGDGFVSLLASQLDRISNFHVKKAVAGEMIQHGDVIVVPVENRMTVAPDGRIDFTDDPWKGHYKPSIDCVIKDVTDSFKSRSGVIIFSGMGADGVLASQKYVEQYQGIIWAQTPETCVISSMPDSVRKANLVSYSGSPEALALKISMFYKDKDSGEH